MGAKTNLLRYGITKETEFMHGLNELINDDNINIKRMEDQYASVDFIITSKTNNLKLYIELKSRTTDISKYNTFFIGRTKLCNISNIYDSDCVVLIWNDTFKNLFYKLYTDELLNSDIKHINGSDVFCINKSECKTSTIATLAECIVKYHNQPTLD